MSQYCDPMVNVSASQKDAAQKEKGAANPGGDQGRPEPQQPIESARSRAVERGEVAFNMYS